MPRLMEGRKITLSNEALAIQSLFHLQDKRGKKVKFVFNSAQSLFDRLDNPTEPRKIIIAKCRQKGVTQGAIAKFAVRCLGVEGTHAVIISHEADATQRLLSRVDYLFKHMNGPRPTFGSNSRKEITFPVRDSTYFIGTAGSRVFGRGDWITDLHCSEYAWWEAPVDHTAGLFQAVPFDSGRIYVESTGNGRNNDFYYTWEHAEGMGYTRLFIPWYVDEEYTLPVGSWKPDFPLFNDLLYDLQIKHNLSDQAMAWYEMKLKNFRGNLRMMQQEYPSTPEECFQATGGTIFENVQLQPSPNWESVYREGYYIYKENQHPNPDLHYVIGADPSGGTGHDNAGINIFCIETWEQVLELSNNTINPIAFAEILCSLGKEYNDAFIVCESNNHGAAVIPYLRDNYPRDKIYKRKYATSRSPAIYGWHNNDTNKHALVGLVQEGLDQLTLYGMQTVSELKSFEESASGKMGASRDDLVIATGLAMVGLRKYEYLRDEYLTPKHEPPKEKPNYMTYTLEEVLENIAQRKRLISGYGIHAGMGYPNG